jgi:hypothetical protein
MKNNYRVYFVYLRKTWVTFYRDAPDIRPDIPAFFDIRYPAGYQIAQPDTGYPANV